MKLTDLDPRWIIDDGRRIGFVFKSPTDSKWYQTVMFETRPRQTQWTLVADVVPTKHVQGAKPDFAWTCVSHADLEQATFGQMTVHPSVDGSPGGLWHGWITDGQLISV